MELLLFLYYVFIFIFQEVEREISFRTESGLYYSYYKTMVLAPSITDGIFLIRLAAIQTTIKNKLFRKNLKVFISHMLIIKN